MLRESRNITQSQLAQSIGITPTTVSRLETAGQTPSVAIVEKIAAYFNVSVDFILGKTSHREDIPKDTLELCDLFIETGQPVELVGYLKWLYSQKAIEKRFGSRDGIDESYKVLFPEMSDYDWVKLAEKYDAEFLIKLVRVPDNQRAALMKIVQAFLDSIAEPGEEPSSGQHG